MEEDKRRDQIKKRLAKEKQDKSILILGGATHFASHILEKLMGVGEVPDETGGSRITVVDSKDPKVIFINPNTRGCENSPRIATIQVSPYDWDWLAESKNDYDVIINAWNVHDAVYAMQNPIDTVQRNVVQSQALMHALIKGTGWDGRLIHCSTDKVYGKTGDDYVKPMKQKSKPIPETATLAPVGVRAVTRAAQETVILGMCRAVGMKFVCLRVGSWYGNFMPQEKSISSWVRSLLLAQPLKIFGEFSRDDSPARDWVNIMDVSALIGFCALSDWPTNVRNEIYNVGAMEKQPHYVQNVSEALKLIIRKGSPSIKQNWREPGEIMLRIWLDSKKAHEKLLFLPQTEFIYSAARDLSLWIAWNELKWTPAEMEILKKNLGIDRRAPLSLAAMRDTSSSTEAEEDQGHGHLSSQLG